MTQLATQSVGHSEVVALLDAIRAKITKDRLSEGERRQIEDATDCIETLTKVWMIPAVAFDWSEYHLTARQAAIAEYLRINFGKARSKEQILTSLYYDRPNDIPDPKIVDVFISKLRWVLRAQNCPYAVETIWGFGYKMVEATEEALATTPAGSESDWGARRAVTWNDVVMTKGLADLAEKLSSPLGSIVTFSDRSSLKNGIMQLRIRLAGRFVIETIRGIGYKMSPLEAVRA